VEEVETVLTDHEELISAKLELEKRFHMESSFSNDIYWSLTMTVRDSDYCAIFIYVYCCLIFLLIAIVLLLLLLLLLRRTIAK